MPLLLGCAVAAIAVTLRLNRRADLTDPAEIAKLPGNELRDGEIERLVRAAFMEAKSAHIKSEAARSITVSDQAILRRLAEHFAIGHDDEQLPMYQHPGLEYTVVTFDGPYTPQLAFTGPKDAMLMSDKPGPWPRFRMHAKFGRTLADLLGLKVAGQGKPAGRHRRAYGRGER